MLNNNILISTWHKFINIWSSVYTQYSQNMRGWVFIWYCHLKLYKISVKNNKYMMNEELTDLELLYNVLLLPSALSLIHRLLYNGNT